MSHTQAQPRLRDRDRREMWLATKMSRRCSCRGAGTSPLLAVERAFAVSPAWDVVKSYVFKERLRRETPSLWANFEALAVAHKRRIHESSTYVVASQDGRRHSLSDLHAPLPDRAQLANA